MTSALPDADRIVSLLRGSTPWRDVRVVSTTGSTHADLGARARSGEREGAVLVSMEQTAGRGRLDRSWASPPGSSIAMSLLLRPRPAFPQWGWLSILAGLAVSSALAEVAPNPKDVTLKWPNDVLIDDRKVCGILSERVDDAAVIGMGINTTLTDEQLPVPTATSLALEGSTADVTDVVGEVLQALERAYRRWLDDDDLRFWFAQRCSTVGRRVRVQQSDTQGVDGLALGVDEWGRLLVRTSLGERAFAAGDVLHLR